MHRCPAKDCTLQVRDDLLACRPHWFALSKPVRQAIWATASLPTPHPNRRAALAAAIEEAHRG